MNDTERVARLAGGPMAEVLPPDSGYTVRRPVRRRRATFFAKYLLVGINVAVYLAMVMNHVSPTLPTVGQITHWGAGNAGLVLYYGQWWRIVTAMFVHVGFLHIGLNMWCLWALADLAEPVMGSVGLIVVYLLTGAAGNLLSTLVNWWEFLPEWQKHHIFLVFPAGAGASGAVFGIAGALIVLLKSPRLPVPQPELKRIRRSVIYFAGINLVLGFSINVGTSMIGSGIVVDNMAHLGGFLCGLLFALPMVPRLGSTRELFRTRLAWSMAMVTGTLVLFGYYLSVVAGVRAPLHV
ncbi:MAG: rhomboid family intramembrane serine protease [Acidobacteriota bacterium]|nr:rhomboid family intramembrane serine protease [Acidobacteriota bacterium]